MVRMVSFTSCVFFHNIPKKKKNLKIFLIQCFLKDILGTSLVVQGLTVYALHAGGPGSVPGLGTRPHTTATIKSSNAATKDATCHKQDPRSQINMYFLKISEVLPSHCTSECDLVGNKVVSV